MRNVESGENENQANGPERDQKVGANRTGDRFPERYCMDAESLILWVLGREIACDHIQICPRSNDRPAAVRRQGAWPAR